MSKTQEYALLFYLGYSRVWQKAVWAQKVAMAGYSSKETGTLWIRAPSNLRTS